MSKLKCQNYKANHGAYCIRIKGAHCHNLKNLSVSIPKYKLVVVTGISGSGKSSLVFDTLYKEGQRRFLESLMSFKWQNRYVYERGDVDSIEGLSPTIAISQKSFQKNPRSTVGTITEIYDYLRLLYSEVGAFDPRRVKSFKLSENLPQIELRLFSFNNPEGACSACEGLGVVLKIDLDLLIPNKGLSILEGAIRLLLSIGSTRSSFSKSLLHFARGKEIDLSKPVSKLNPYELGAILEGEKDYQGIAPYLEKKYRETESPFIRLEIERCMRSFSCPQCLGARLNSVARSIVIFGYSIDELASMPLSSLLAFLKSKEEAFKTIFKKLVREIISRVELVASAGLSYITLSRGIITISPGELQRIRLATQIGLGMSGITYILDEPSMGLHPRDIQSLIFNLQHLKSLDNTVIVVEHDQQIIESADYIIDIGPGAGEAGGKLVAHGTPLQFIAKAPKNSLTALYLRRKRSVSKIRYFNKNNNKELIIKGAKEHNLKNITVKIPIGAFVCVSGVSGSGKSTLIHDILARYLLQKFYRAKKTPGAHEKIIGIEYLNKAIIVDQSPIGRSPRSNLSTYIGLFDCIRDFFAELPESRRLRYVKNQFSFNTKSGQCDTCKGEGEMKVNMYFLPDVYIPCSDCKGKRYKQDVLEIRWKAKNIGEILDMSVHEALSFFEDSLQRATDYLLLLERVGLSYLKLGQPATTLSGGEAQRIKLAAELARPSTGNTLYILDEPTVGLHFADIERLLNILHKLVDKGNTVLIIEHNIDVIKSCDWVIDLGPGGGEMGGEVVACGTPREIAKVKESYTGQFLRKALN